MRSEARRSADLAERCPLSGRGSSHRAGTVAALKPDTQGADRPRMQHAEAEASDPIMRRRLPTAERTMTRQVISAELTEKSTQRA